MLTRLTLLWQPSQGQQKYVGPERGRTPCSMQPSNLLPHQEQQKKTYFDGAARELESIHGPQCCVCSPDVCILDEAEALVATGGLIVRHVHELQRPKVSKYCSFFFGERVKTINCGYQADRASQKESPWAQRGGGAE